MEDANFVRQLDFFDPEKFGDTRVEVIGAGGIGSFTVLALAKLGMKNIRVWDGDVVNSHNLPNQLFPVDSVAKPKVEALQEHVKAMTGTEIETVPEFWDGEPLSGVVIVAVDSMEHTAQNPQAGRREVWKAVQWLVSVKLLVDARIGGENIRVLALSPVGDVRLHKWYQENLFPQAESAELPCTGRAVIDVGFMVAAIITNVVRSFLSTGNCRHDTIVDVKNLEMLRMEV